METAVDSEDAWVSRSVKRKLWDPASSSATADAKRMRLGDHSDRTYHLPAEIWHRTLSLLPPKTLGCLLSVNKQFHRYLDPSLVEDNLSQPCQDSLSILPPLKPDAIWQASRRLFWPHMPGPLKGRSELEMWRLCCTRSCQFCGIHERSETGRTQDQWHRGPGAKGVSPVFPLFIVTCGRCLSENTTKEVHLFLSPSMPSFLLAGLPMIFVTSEMHVVPPQLLSNGTDPTHPQVAKVFSSEQARAIHAEFGGVKELGYAAAEEWVKGLEARGKRSLADASRWERWYLAGGVHDMRASLQNLQSSNQKTEANSCTRILNSQPSINEPQRSGGDAVQQRTSVRDLTRTQSKAENVAAKPGLRLDQTMPAEEEATKLKASRRAEIEGRAALLDPPFTPSELSRVPAFLAMIRIPAPLDESDWETLKQRLLDHREAAERRERGGLAPTPFHPDSIDAAGTKATSPQSARQVADKQVDETQKPLEDMISGFADDIIRHRWKDGAKLPRKEASQFAVEVLLYVRQRFHAETAIQAAATPAAGGEVASSPLADQKLMLEHMKWIFETKIKRHTDPHGTDLFFCAACSGNRKAFGLQAVVQHYAAKHTNALSIGNTVVHWKAEWPETPIFESDPKRKRTKQAGEGFNSAALPNQALPSGASSAFNQTQAPNASQALPVPASTELVTIPENPRQPPRPPQDSVRPSHLQQSQLAGPRPPAQGLAASATVKDHTSRKSKSAIAADSTKRGQYVARLNCMARVCKETWRKIANIQYLPDPAKAHVLLHHVVARFEEKFSERASLSTFIDGLSNHKDMRPARSIKNLRCKICHLSPSAEAKTNPLTFPQLLKHFKEKHGEGTGEQLGNGSVDWHVDMIRLPDQLAIPELQKGLGKQEASLQMIIDALPWAGQVESHRTPAVDQRQGPMNGSRQQKRPACNAGNTSYGPSRATGFQHQPERKSNPAKAENSQGKHATAMNKNATPSHEVATYDYGARPDLRPARVVYGPAESPRRYLIERDAFQGGKIYQARPSISEFPGADAEQHTLAASAPYGRLHQDGFEIFGSLESHVESERGTATPRDVLPRNARYGALPRTISDPVDHASNREYIDGRYGEPYPYALPGYDGGYYQGPGPWGPQVAAAIRQGTRHHPYGYEQGFPAQSVRLADPYEVVELRNRLSDYPAKRLVQRDEGGYYPCEPRAPDLYPRRGSVVYGELGPPAAYAPRPPSRMDYEEYDPRYPETGRDAVAAASREARC